MKTKKVFKYGTGMPIPNDAEYLTTVVQEIPEKRSSDPTLGEAGRDVLAQSAERYVWHYFLVTVCDHQRMINGFCRDCEKVV